MSFSPLVPGSLRRHHIQAVWRQNRKRTHNPSGSIVFTSDVIYALSFAHDARPGFPWVPFFPGSFAGFREPVPGPIPCTAHIFCIFLAHHSFFRQPFPGSVPAVPAAAVSLVRSSFVSSCLIFSYRCFFFCVPVFFCFSRSFLRVSR